jgi:hypothetical protein
MTTPNIQNRAIARILVFEQLSGHLSGTQLSDEFFRMQFDITNRVDVVEIVKMFQEEGGLLAYRPEQGIFIPDENDRRYIELDEKDDRKLVDAEPNDQALMQIGPNDEVFNITRQDGRKERFPGWLLCLRPGVQGLSMRAFT